MATIILDRPGQFSTSESKPSPRRNAGEALVRIHRVGICGTDLHAFEGTQPFFSYPRILGHELGVEIIEIDDNEYGLSAGDRCSVEPYLHCGTCQACRRGMTNCCEQIKVLGVHVDGGMREQITVPTGKLHKSEILSFEQLALVETLGIGAHAIRRAQVLKDDLILIIGAGPIGLTATAFAKLTGAAIAVMDISAHRLEFCRQTLGIETTIAIGDDPVRQIRDVFGGRLPSIVVDCTGNPKSMMNTIQYAAHAGTIVFVGLFIGDFSFHDPDFHKKEATLKSSRNSTRDDFLHVIQALESGAVDVQPWITHRVPHHEMIGSFPTWIGPESGVIKAVVEW